MQELLEVARPSLARKMFAREKRLRIDLGSLASPVIRAVSERLLHYLHLDDCRFRFLVDKPRKSSVFSVTRALFSLQQERVRDYVQ